MRIQKRKIAEDAIPQERGRGEGALHTFKKKKRGDAQESETTVLRYGEGNQEGKSPVWYTLA